MKESLLLMTSYFRLNNHNYPAVYIVLLVYIDFILLMLTGAVVAVINAIKDEFVWPGILKSIVAFISSLGCSAANFYFVYSICLACLAKESIL